MKVLSDVSMAKEHVRLGRQSYTGIPTNLLSKATSMHNMNTNNTTASRIILVRFLCLNCLSKLIRMF